MSRAVLALVLVSIIGVVGPGLRSPLSGVGSHCLIAQSRELPAPGNPDHERPPDGERCVHNDRDPAHNCSCHRECKQNTDDDGNAVQGGHVQEDPKCRVYCFKDHCHCPVANCE